MELCISGVISNLPHLWLFSSRPSPLFTKTSLPLKNLTVFHRNSGFHYFATPSRAEISKERIGSVSESFEKQSDGVVTVDEYLAQDVPTVTKAAEEVAKEEPPIIKDEDPAQDVQFESKAAEVVKEEPPITLDEDPAHDVQFETKAAEEVANEESPMNEQPLAFEFLDKLNIKLDSADTYPILLYGSGALVALWLASAVISAIDSIPVFPKVLELVGLAVAIWFGSRYLIFKKNRDELTMKIEELKQQIIGSRDD